MQTLTRYACLFFLIIFFAAFFLVLNSYLQSSNNKNSSSTVEDAIYNSNLTQNSTFGNKLLEDYTNITTPNSTNDELEIPPSVEEPNANNTEET